MNKRIRVVIYIIAVLWVVAGSQLLVQKFFISKSNIMEAFVNTNAGLMESTLEVTGQYSEGFLTESDQQMMISYIAAKLGIKMDVPAAIVQSNGRQVAGFTKEASRAKTEIKIVSLPDVEEKEASHYIIVRLSIYEDVNNDALAYQKIIEKGFAQLGCSRVDSTLQFAGTYAGDLTLEAKNKIADKMIQSLEGKVVYANREDGMFTIYAYSGSIKKYIIADQKKINIQVAMTYDKNTDQTKVYLATPIITGDW